MTIMDWGLAPDCAMILCDSLNSDCTYAPSCFSSKSGAIPHLQIIMGAKGSAWPMDVLWRRCSDGLAVFDVDELADIAGPIVFDAYAEIRHRLPEDECAVFIFGWSPKSGRIVGYAFRFENGFRCEKLQDGREIIPALKGPVPTDWLAVALQQQAEDRALPLADRDNIGGWLVASQLIAVPGGRAVVQIENLCRLPHFDDDAAFLATKRPDLLPPTLERWQCCEHWLGDALAYDPAGITIEAVRAGYQAGKYILIDGAASAALVERIASGGNFHLQVYLAGGRLPEILDGLRPKWEALAQRLEVATVVLAGRRGWARALSPFGYHFVTRTSPKNWITAKAMRRPPA